MVNKQRINEIVVRPVKGINRLSPEQIKGGEVIGEFGLYWTLFNIARRNSGKSTLVNHILRLVASKDNTTIIFFVGNFYNDDIYTHIADYLDKKGINYEVYLSIQDGKNNTLAEINERMKAEAEAKKEQERLEASKKGNEEYHPIFHPFVNGNELRVKVKKKGKQSPDYIVILDDLSPTELKNKAVIDIFQLGRHWRTCLYVSSQYIKNLLPVQINNVNFFLIFAGMSPDKLKTWLDLSGINIKYETFMEMYNDAVSKPHSFLFCSSSGKDFRQNFDVKYET